MPMPKMVPETYGGKEILRPVDYSGPTPNLASSTVFFPPSISIVEPYEPLGLLVEREANAIVAMKAMTTSELRSKLHTFALGVIANEKRRIPNG